MLKVICGISGLNRSRHIDYNYNIFCLLFGGAKIKDETSNLTKGLLPWKL